MGESPILGKFGGKFWKGSEMRKNVRKREKGKEEGKGGGKAKERQGKIENGEGKEGKIVKVKEENLHWKGKTETNIQG